ncbi:hypothetical protein XELAEV_18006953mg [Xenopus laevis]|uniref:Uncharacterized protein n=1 Tax=Xenopus laevis TaxID=8355 RepID=A0A974E229_XENLA|nr:hypothetical protein XELAEV_18006953mg [Xenopus laevis]
MWKRLYFLLVVPEKSKYKFNASSSRNVTLLSLKSHNRHTERECFKCRSGQTLSISTESHPRNARVSSAQVIQYLAPASTNKRRIN